MRARQRELARDAVLEGRDTGTRVCPDAEVKVYLTASLAERARRRASELGIPTPEVERAIAERDRRDAEQLAAGARRAHDGHDRPRRRAGGRARARAGARGGGVTLRTTSPASTAPGGCSGSSLGPLVWVLLRPRVGAAARRRAGRCSRVEPRVVVGHPGARLVQPRSIRYMAKRELFGSRSSAGSCAGAGLPRAPRRARPRRASDRARDGRGRRRGRHLHPGPPPGRARGRQGRRGPLRGRRGRPRRARGDPRHAELAARAGASRIAFGEPRVFERGDRRPGEAYRETADELMAEIRRLYELAG